MKIIDNPTQEQLETLQFHLEKDLTAGIMDIYPAVEGYYMVAIDGDSAIGVVTISHLNGDAEIYKLYIIPNYRRQGVASKLVDAALLSLENNGLNEVFVQIVNDSYLFWEPFLSLKRTTKLDCDKYIIHLD